MLSTFLHRKAVALAVAGFGSAAGIAAALVLILASPTPQARTVETITPTATTIPAPTTVSGYRAMFAGLDETTWGASDIGISIRLYDGRRVWLYGDTLSNRYGMVRSTAITQTGGSLHVSNAGRQLFPTETLDDGRTQLYWPEKVARQTDGDLTVTTAPVIAGTAGIWDMERHPTDSRLAELGIEADGDVVFKRWLRYVPRPDIQGDGEDNRFHPDGEWGHYAYWDIVHADIVLADGSRLKTNSQNWEARPGEDLFDAHRRTEDNSIDYDDWDIEFSSVAAR